MHTYSNYSTRSISTILLLLCIVHISLVRQITSGLGRDAAALLQPGGRAPVGRHRRGPAGRPQQPHALHRAGESIDREIG